ncbi:MAG: acetolactate synthase small subunit [Chloroflexota bacterium]
MKYTLAAWMRDKPGVLNRVSGLLRRRNFNIDSLQVSSSEEPGISRMTFVVDGDAHMADQVIKQLRKIVDVTRVENLSDRPIVSREMALMRVNTTPETRADIVQIVSIYRGDVIDVALDSMVIQVVETEEKVDSIIELMDNFGLLELVRTGPVVVTQGKKQQKFKGSTAVWRASSMNGNGATDKLAARMATGGV